MHFLYFTLSLLAFLTPSKIYAQHGRIIGKITEIGTEAALIGANVTIKGTNWGAATDAQGYYLISHVPQGTYDIEVSYLGYQTISKYGVVILPDQTKQINFVVQSSAIEMKEIVITASTLAQSQATALNSQREALTIKSIVSSDLMGLFPDINAAEALQRLPAISITRDHGEGRFVVLRGIPPAYNSTMINGQRIPSAEEEGRTVALDLIPADLIETIEVSKSQSAEMDGDAIGGNVNLIMKQAPDRRIFNATVGYGLNRRGTVRERQNSKNDIGRLNVITGDSFENGKVGYLLSGSYYNTFLTTAGEEAKFDFDKIGDAALDDGTIEVQTRDYEIQRVRFGVNGSLLYKPTIGQKFYIRGIFNRFSDQEFRHRVIRNMGKSEVTRDLKDRLEVQTIEHYTLGAEHFFTSGLKVDYLYALTKNKTEQPNQQDIAYSLKFEDSALAIPRDSLGYSFKDFEISSEEVNDRDHVVAANLLIPFKAGAIGHTIKLGFKGRFKNRSFKQTIEYKAELKEGTEKFYLPGGSATTEFPDPVFQFSIPLELTDKQSDDLSAIAENYKAKETILAGYLQGKLWFGNRLMFLPGIRVERTLTENASEFNTFAESEDNNHDYLTFLPSLNVRYNFSNDINIRFAATRSISRPNFSDLVPFDILDDDERKKGNPQLRPVKAGSVDLLFEWFDTKFVGLLSFGLFHKDLINVIEVLKSPDPENATVTLIQPRNSGNASIKGLEIAILKKLGFISLRNFGLVANYTFSDSEVKLNNRENRNLARHSAHTANLGLSYNNIRLGLSGQISWHFKGRNLSSPGKTPEEDKFEDNNNRLDISFTQRITSSLSFFFEGKNLTNEPQRIFVLNPSNRRSIVQLEHYEPSFVVGFKLNL